MNELTVINYQGKYVIDSRIVAEMVDKRHDHLLRDINGYVEILNKSTDPKVGVSDFFILDDYKDSTGRTLPCYLITRKGCDMVANKMTGEKGVLFTAAYVTKFEEMEQAIKETQPQVPMTIEDMIIMQAQSVKELKYKVDEVEAKSEYASEQAERAHKRLDELDAIDPNGTPRQQLSKLVTHYAERNGLQYAEGWRKFREAYNIAYHTNVMTLANNYKARHGIRQLTIPDYLEKVDKIPDALRVANKMLHPANEYYV